jgi:arylsulfatase A-like enzyme
MFASVTKGMLSGKAGGTAHEEFKVNGQYVNTPDKGVVGIPFVDEYIEDASADYLKRAYKAGTPFFAHINFMKVHQPNLPHPDYIGKSLSKSKYADSLVELDSRVGRLMDTIRELDKDNNTIVLWTTDNGAWQDVYPDAGYTPFRGSKGTVREGGARVPFIAWWPGKIAARSRNNEITGGLDFMATFAALGGVTLPLDDREGKPIIFDSYDLSPVLFGTGKSPRNQWFYFTENELLPGAVRIGNYKFVFNLRGDDGAATGGLAVDTNLGWKGADKYVSIVPQIFDLWQDPQERYDIVMTTFTERTGKMIEVGPVIQQIAKTYIEYPPRKQQSEGYTGPITLSQYERFAHVREVLAKEGVSIPMPTGN